MKSEVYISIFGEAICGCCGYELECNDCGDMPEICPECGSQLDYEHIDEEE